MGLYSKCGGIPFSAFHQSGSISCPKLQSKDLCLPCPQAPNTAHGKRPLTVGSWDCNKVPQAGWFIKSRSLFLTALEVGSLRSGCQRGRGLGTALLQAADGWFLMVPSQGEERREEAGSWRDSHQDARPVHEDSTLMTSSNPNDLSQPPPSPTIILGERV